jgi:hypothetical protein
MGVAVQLIQDDAHQQALTGVRAEHPQALGGFGWLD